jgi:transcriptional regulator with XRE-family HTH domain
VNGIYMSEAFINHLKKYMLDHKLSQAELAKQIQMPESGLSNILIGKTRRPQDDTLERIADATGKSYIEIKAMLDPRLAKDLQTVTSQPAYSAEARLLLEEFDKMPEVTKKAILTLVLGYKPTPHLNKKKE